jgi:hypothetical protein
VKLKDIECKCGHGNVIETGENHKQKEDNDGDQVPINDPLEAIRGGLDNRAIGETFIQDQGRQVAAHVGGISDHEDTVIAPTRNARHQIQGCDEGRGG